MCCSYYSTTESFNPNYDPLLFWKPEPPFIPGTHELPSRRGLQQVGLLICHPGRTSLINIQMSPSEQRKAVCTCTCMHTHTAVSVLPDKPFFLSSWHTRLPSCPPSPLFIWASPQEITSVACVRILLYKYTPHKCTFLYLSPPPCICNPQCPCSCVSLMCTSWPITCLQTSRLNFQTHQHPEPSLKSPKTPGPTGAC